MFGETTIDPNPNPTAHLKKLQTHSSTGFAMVKIEVKGIYKWCSGIIFAPRGFQKRKFWRFVKSNVFFGGWKWKVVFSVKSFSGFWKMSFGDFIVCFVGSFWKDLI